MLKFSVEVSPDTTTKEANNGADENDLVALGHLDQATKEYQDDSAEISSQKREDDFFNNLECEVRCEACNKGSAYEHDPEGRSIELISGAYVVGDTEENDPNYTSYEDDLEPSINFISLPEENYTENDGNDTKVFLASINYTRNMFSVIEDTASSFGCSSNHGSAIAVGRGVSSFGSTGGPKLDGMFFVGISLALLGGSVGQNKSFLGFRFEL